ncbi:MAG: nucleotidyltransferase, partial [Persicimonas sp.]
ASSDVPGEETIPPEGVPVAREAMSALHAAGLPFLVAGAYALAVHTGIERQTEDFDVVVREEDVERALSILTEAGFRTEMESEIWIAKAHRRGEYVDLIFNSGNATTHVDDRWFEHATEARVFGCLARVCPPEELIWSKSYIMERERFDGADVIHLFRACAEQLDWDRLLERFGDHWRVLLSHLILYGFVYPGKRDAIPARVMHRLLGRARGEIETAPTSKDLCRGTLLSRAQYAVDLDKWGCEDARVQPHGTLTQDQANELSPPYRPRSPSE